MFFLKNYGHIFNKQCLSCLLFCLFFCSHLVKADIYIYTDQNGEKVYTDKYVKGAKKIKTTPKKIVKPNNDARANVPRQPPPPPYNSPYKLLRILFPYPDSIIEDNKKQKLLASVISEPSLQQGHKYHLLINDFSAGSPKATPVFELNDLPQGTYYLAVEILDEYERILDRTPAQPIHVLRSFME